MLRVDPSWMLILMSVVTVLNTVHGKMRWQFLYLYCARLECHLCMRWRCTAMYKKEPCKKRDISMVFCFLALENKDGGLSFGIH